MGMKSLGEILRLGKKQVEPVIGESLDPELPPGRFSNYLIVRGWVGQDPSHVVQWVDHACLRGECRAKWHLYRSPLDARARRAPYRVAVRCPRGLSVEECKLVRADEPPGAWESDLRAARVEMLAAGRAKWEAG